MTQKQYISTILKSMGVGALAGAAFGFLGLIIYSILAGEITVLVNIGTYKNFTEFFLMIIMGFVMPPVLLFSLNMIYLSTLINMFIGAIVGFIASVMAGKFCDRPTVTAIVCSGVAIVPTIIFLLKGKPSSFFSTNLLFSYIPFLLLATFSGYLGVQIQSWINTRTPKV